MAQRTRSLKKRAAKAHVANANLLDRLRRLKAQPIDPKLLKVIVGDTPLSAKEATMIWKQINDLMSDFQRVTEMRHELEQVPSLIVTGSVLL